MQPLREHLFLLARLGNVELKEALQAHGQEVLVEGPATGSSTFRLAVSRVNDVGQRLEVGLISTVFSGPDTSSGTMRLSSWSI